ncbi:MAG: phosphotransferase [Acetobacter sp.]|nr:phosphotransferase [Bacteroides sp.]MCM1341197.1 phosphotransferase [Acetobacter sp.]MCM1433840.1 phosphotransferase [Clostridiales bacterium]
MATIIDTREHKNIYRDGDKLVKEFDETFTKAEVLNEALNDARVEETGLNIPRLLDVRKTETGWAITREYIEGETLSEIMKKNPDKEDEYLEKFVDIQLEIHSKKAPHLNKIKDKMHSKISASSYEATIRFDLHNRLEGMKKHTKVLHGDYCPSNIIVTPEGEYYIIDWSHATQGNASADAARTYLVFVLQGKEDTAEKYLNLFCKKADIPKQLVQQWMPIVACSESVKNIEGEKELLDKWVNVFDFQ